MEKQQTDNDFLARLGEALARERDAMREQLAAAWQLHVARVEEQLVAGWKAHIERVLDERFSEFERIAGDRFRQLLAEGVEAGAAARLDAACRAARNETANALAGAAAGLRAADTEDAWVEAVLSAAGLFSDRVAVLVRAQGGWRLAGVRGFTPGDGAAGLLQEPDGGGVPEIPARMLGGGTEEPPRAAAILSGGKPVAAICFSGGDPAMEAVASLAGMAHERLTAAAAAEESARPPASPVPDWSGLTREQQDLHLRAQRFARVQVAEMRLYQSPAVTEGRAKADLYGMLREPIDRSREAYRREFLNSSPGMTDYLHLELIRTLANDDAGLLGPDYPGPLA